MNIRTERPRTQPPLLSVNGFAEVVDGWQNAWTTVASQPAFAAAIVAGLLVGLLAGGSPLRNSSLPFSVVAVIAGLGRLPEATHGR